MRFKTVILLASFFFMPSLFATGLVNFGYRLAGGDLVTSYTNVTTESKGGYGVRIGGNIAWKKDMSWDIYSGYSVDFLDQSGSGKSLVQFPIEALFKYDAKIMHLGIGLNATWAGLGTKFEFLSSYEAIAGSISYVIVGEFPLVKDFSRYVGLKTKHIFLNTSWVGQSINEAEFFFGYTF